MNGHWSKFGAAALLAASVLAPARAGTADRVELGSRPPAEQTRVTARERHVRRLRARPTPPASADAPQATETLPEDALPWIGLGMAVILTSLVLLQPDRRPLMTLRRRLTGG